MTTRADHHGDGSPPADLVQTSALSANPRVLTGLNRTSANNYGALTPRKPPNQVIESAHGGGQELHTCCAAAHNDPPTPPPPNHSPTSERSVWKENQFVFTARPPQAMFSISIGPSSTPTSPRLNTSPPLDPLITQTNRNRPTKCPTVWR